MTEKGKEVPSDLKGALYTDCAIKEEVTRPGVMRVLKWLSPCVTTHVQCNHDQPLLLWSKAYIARSEYSYSQIRVPL